MQGKILFLVIAVAALAVILGYTAQPIISDPGTQQIITGKATPTPQPTDKVYLLLPAVDDNGNGRLADLLVELKPGTGKAFIAFQDDTPLLAPETQESLKIAMELGKLYATRDTSKYDLLYTMNAPSAIVGGKSAGAAVAVATVALLQGTMLRGDTLITGGVDEHGNVTPVGGVLEKARAVKQAGFRKLIVPRGERTASVVKQDCRTQTVSGGSYQKCTATTVQVDIATEVGIEITEVDNVQQAVKELRN